MLVLFKYNIKLNKMKIHITTVVAYLFLATAAAGQATAEKAAFTLSLDSYTAKIERQLQPQIVDARSPEEFAFNHIEGAVNFNLQSGDYNTFVQALDKNKPVFVYSINTGRSSALVKDLINKGFVEAYDLQGGIANWVGGGRPYYTASKNGLTPGAYKKLLASNSLVLTDIGSRYCGSCKKVKPVLDSLRQEYGAQLKIIEVDLEDSPQLISELKTVNVFPYLILYKQGKVVYTKSGLNELKDDIETALAKAK